MLSKDERAEQRAIEIPHEHAIEIVAWLNESEARVSRRKSDDSYLTVRAVTDKLARQRDRLSRLVELGTHDMLEQEHYIAAARDFIKQAIDRLQRAQLEARARPTEPPR